jgi:hypothetical protein
MHKEIEPDGPGETHQQGLDQDQQYAVDTHPPEQPVIFEGKADEHFPGDKGSYGGGYRQGIAHETGAKPKPGFELEALAANGAMFGHLHKGLEMIRVGVQVEIPPATTGTFVTQNAREECRFVVAMWGFDGFYCTHND